MRGTTFSIDKVFEFFHHIGYANRDYSQQDKIKIIFLFLSNSSDSASRVFVRVLFWAESLPDPDPVEQTLLVAIIMHGSAMAFLTLMTGALWAGICLSGNVAYKILIR